MCVELRDIRALRAALESDVPFARGFGPSQRLGSLNSERLSTALQHAAAPVLGPSRLTPAASTSSAFLSSTIFAGVETKFVYCLPRSPDQKSSQFLPLRPIFPSAFFPDSQSTK